MLRIASEKNINGQYIKPFRLNLFDEVCIAGRTFGVVPRDEFISGHMDLLHDDYQNGDFLKEWQETVLETAESIVNLV